MSDEYVAHFWHQVSKGDGCWEWQGGCNRVGYGRVSFDGKMRLAHRVAIEFAYGPIPEKMSVLHTCDNPACCRNDDAGWYEVNGVLYPRRGHLWLGKHVDNTADMIAKGRIARGTMQPHAKLTEEQVRAIRKRYAMGGISLEGLGSEYGVSLSLTHLIVHRKVWAHVAD